MFIASKEF